MNSRSLMTFIAMCIPLLSAAAALGDETEAGRTRTRFTQLLHVGESVLLRTVNEHPAYTIQLLSDEQAEEIKTAYTAYLELRQRRDAIEAQLDTEARLDERATLFVQHQKLGVEISNVSEAKSLGIYAYEISQVGEDFVTLKTPRIERFVPLHSIRDMFRTDRLPSYRRNSSRRSSVDLRVGLRKTTRLKNKTAAEVAAAVRKVYPDSKAELTVDAASNSLILVGDRTSVTQIEELVGILDAELPEPTADQ